MTTPATAEQLAAEIRRRGEACIAVAGTKRQWRALGELQAAIDALAAMAKAAEVANSSAQQSGEAVAWLWEYIGKDPYPASLYKGKYIARSLVEMDPNSPPHPGTWRPVRPLYTRPQQSGEG